MKRTILLLVALTACGTASSGDRHGFVALLGRDTVSLELDVRRGDTLTSDEVDRFPRVRERHTVVALAPDGSIRHLAMDIREPSGTTPAARERRFVADVGTDSVRITVTDSAGTHPRAYATGGVLTMPHVSQMYGLSELYMDAAVTRGRAAKIAAGDSIHVMQFYADREFDEFPIHEGWVQPLGGGKVKIWHDWLSGFGMATFDSTGRMLAYDGAGSTYKVIVKRLTELPDVASVGTQFASAEQAAGGAKQLSPRDTARGSVGKAAITVDYGRPTARGRVLLGDVIPYGDVWRTGANAATQFSTSTHITLAGLDLPAGKYTLWSMPRSNGTADLIVNRQTGQWGTQYDEDQDLGQKPLVVAPANSPVERFTISVTQTDATHGALVLEWGTFRWTAAIVVK